MSFTTCSAYIFFKCQTKSISITWKLCANKWFKFGFCVNNSGFDKCLFPLIVLLKPDFNCANNFAFSWVDKVTTGT